MQVWDASLGGIINKLPLWVQPVSRGSGSFTLNPGRYVGYHETSADGRELWTVEDDSTSITVSDETTSDTIRTGGSLKFISSDTTTLTIIRSGTNGHDTFTLTVTGTGGSLFIGEPVGSGSSINQVLYVGMPPINSARVNGLRGW